MTKEFKKSFRYCYNLFLFCEKYIIIVINKRVQMFSKQQIIDTLNSEDLFLDNFLLEAFIKNWKIEPIYEDAQGVEFFDDMAVEKIRNGIKQKEPKSEINIIDKETYYLLQFFMGNFEDFYNESIKHKDLLGWTNSFEKTAVYLWLLLLIPQLFLFALMFIAALAELAAE